MNYTILGRMLWKEFRTLFSLWAVLLAFGVGMQLLVISLGSGAGTVVIVVMVPTLYVLGSSSVAFASEDEDGTVNLLRAFGAPVLPIFLAKLLFNVLSAGAMMLGLFGMALILDHRNAVGRISGSPEVDHLVVFAAFGVLSLVFGLMFSVLTRRLIPTVLLTAVCSVMTLSRLVMEAGNGDSLPRDTEALNRLFVATGFVVLVVLAVAYWQTQAWLSKEVELSWSWLGRLLTRRSVAPIADSPDTAPPSKRSFKRLLWKEWQHAWRFATVYALLGIVLMIPGNFALPTVLPVSWMVFPLVWLTPLVMGVMSFRSEQTGMQIRFLTHRGVIPQAVWLSKHFVWFLAAIILTVLFVVAAPLTSPNSWISVHSSSSFWEDLRRTYAAMSVTLSLSEVGPMQSTQAGDLYTPGGIGLLGYTVLAIVAGGYAIGQFCSIMFRKSVLAFFVAGLLLVVGVFLVCVLRMFAVPLWWNISMLPLLCMIASLYYSRDWIEESRGWKVRARVLAVVVVPIILMIAGIAQYRVSEIPRVDLSMIQDSSRLKGLSQVPNLAALETGDMYQRALSKTTRVQPADTSNLADHWRWLEENREALTLTLAAAERPTCEFSPDIAARINSMPADLALFQRLPALVITSGRQLEHEGRLDEAFDRYRVALQIAQHFGQSLGYQQCFFIQRNAYDRLRGWAAHPEQSLERLQRAIEILNDQPNNAPDMVLVSTTRRLEVLKDAYRDRSRSLSERLGELAPLSPDIEASLTAIDRWFPWERVRARRLIDFAAVAPLQTILDVRSQFREDVSGNAQLQGDLPTVTRLTPLQTSNVWSTGQARIADLLATTPLLRRVVGHSYALPSVDEVRTSLLWIETSRRATLLTFAVCAWRAEHGHLPERLSALLEAGYDVSIIDPRNRREFGYLPGGMRSIQLIDERQMELHVPLLWSAARSEVLLVPVGIQPNTNNVRYKFVTSDPRSPLSLDQDNLPPGLVLFPIEPSFKPDRPVDQPGPTDADAAAKETDATDSTSAKNTGADTLPTIEGTDNSKANPQPAPPPLPN